MSLVSQSGEIKNAETPSFAGEFTKLMDIIGEILENEPVLRKPVDKYADVLKRTDIEKHRKFFKELYDKVSFHVMTEDEMGTWLTKEDYNIVFGKGERTGAYIPLSKIYRKATARAVSPSINKPLARLYPKIILLHIYRIFDIVNEDQDLQTKISILQRELQGKGTDPMNNMSNILENFKPLLKQFTGDNPQLAGMMDIIENMAKDGKIVDTLANLSENLSGVTNIMQELAPKAMESFRKVSTGESDIGTVLRELSSDIISRPEITRSMESLRPLLKETIDRVQKTGTELPESLVNGIDNMNIGDLIKQLSENPEVQGDFAEFNTKATDFLKGDHIKQIKNIVNNMVEGGVNKDAIEAMLASSVTPQISNTESEQLTDFMQGLTLEQQNELSKLFKK